MNCNELRTQLLEQGKTPAMGSHLSACEHCASYVERWQRLHSGLQQHHARITPDGSFVARVRERMDPAPRNAGLGWAALRLLPLSLVLLAVLVWFSVDRNGGPAATEESWVSALDDPLTWVVNNESLP